jgi:hypothetical protein
LVFCRDGWKYVDQNARTPKEPWRTSVSVNHWYVPCAQFAKEKLGSGRGSLLVIGSPIFEAREHAAAGWEVTYLDVRSPPATFHKIIQACATNIPLPDNSFDAVTSNCVLTHAGLGRYGDPIVKNGDELMLAEIARLMKPATEAAITFGPVVSGQPVQFGNTHRIYTVEEAKRMCAQAGLEVRDIKIWGVARNEWVDTATEDAYNVDYICVAVAKQG